MALYLGTGPAVWEMRNEDGPLFNISPDGREMAESAHGVLLTPNYFAFGFPSGAPTPFMYPVYRVWLVKNAFSTAAWAFVD